MIISGKVDISQEICCPIFGCFIFFLCVYFFQEPNLIVLDYMKLSQSPIANNNSDIPWVVSPLVNTTLTLHHQG